MNGRQFHRPTLFGPAALDTRPGGSDPAERDEAAYATARTLVLGGRDRADPEAVGRLIRLADDHGLDVLAGLWADTPPDSLPGALWRLYVLRTWVRAAPRQAAAEFDLGRRSTPVSEVVAGVGQPPGPDEVLATVDSILRGVYRGDVAVAFERAAAFARVVAVGRTSHPLPDGDRAAGGDTMSAARLVAMAEHLESAAGHWRSGDLQAP